ncbi:MAG: M48 family metallopeptidase [Acidobacteriia bacterium]|nr:M48 family metallopeptidase [Terriglobia bacterium]
MRQRSGHRIILGTALLLLSLSSTYLARAASGPLAGAAKASETGASQAPPPEKPAIRAAKDQEERKVQGYTLTADQREKAIAYSRANYLLYFIGIAYSLALFYFLMRLQWPVQFARWAEGRGTRRRIFQVLIFAPLFLVTLQVMTFPVDYYGEHLEKKFGLSVQSFGSWMLDWLKGLVLGVILGTFLIWILYGVIRRSPRRWWFYFWLATIPIAVFLIFLQPYVIEPLFYKFTPLQETQPKLTGRLLEVVGRAGLDIPESKMYEMNASTKVKALNAYVSGLGSSKRVVVWDTTINKMTPDEIAFVFGHEAGHYVLHHIPKLIALTLLVILVLFYLGYRLVNWAIPRWQDWSGVNRLEDWGSLTFLLLFITILSFVSNPLLNGISRHFEHQADIYGLEVTHGLVPDGPQNAARAFQILGEVDLGDPDPGEFIKVWLYGHPPVAERVAFALEYNPWGEGGRPQFVQVK